jgi:hypothetical protein
MKRRIITGVLIAGLVTISNCIYAQMYYTATSTELIENNGKAWVEKKLPPSVITFSDNSGQAELKTDISSLIEKDTLSVTELQPEINSVADFNMMLDKQKIITQLYSGQVFNTTGFLKINNIMKPVTTQYFLRAAGDYENGFTISVIIRFVPADFNLKIAGETENTPILLRVDDGVVNEI